MKLFSNILLLLILSITISSCSKMSIGFEKRKYRTGYYVDISSIHKEKCALANVSKRNFHYKEINNTPIPVSAVERMNPSFIEQENAAINLSSDHRKNSFMKSYFNSSSDSSINKNLPNVEAASNANEGEWSNDAFFSFLIPLFGILLAFIFGYSGIGEMTISILLIIAGFVAVILGAVAIGELSDDPHLKGLGFAILGIIMGLVVGLLGVLSLLLIGKGP